MTRKRRQLVTNLTAKPAKGQHKKPCDDCPFARHALNGWLGGLTAERWLQIAHGEGQSECHTMTGVDCAGLAIYRANVVKLPRDPAALVLPADHKLCFSTKQEFLKHHSTPLKATAAPKQSEFKTKDPKDQDVCAKLDCRAPCDAEDFCFGCGFFICNDCEADHLPMGQHDVTEHWEGPIL